MYSSMENVGVVVLMLYSMTSMASHHLKSAGRELERAGQTMFIR